MQSCIHDLSGQFTSFAQVQQSKPYRDAAQWFLGDGKAEYCIDKFTEGLVYG